MIWSFQARRVKIDGLKPAVIALVLVALQRVARSALRGPVQSAVAGAAFAAMFFFDVSLLLVMLAAVVLGTALGTLRPASFPYHTKQAAKRTTRRATISAETR